MFKTKLSRRAALCAQVSIFTLGAMTVPQIAFGQDVTAEEPEEDLIIVTMERREQTLQSLAGTGAVLSGLEINQLGLKNIDDLDSQIPGLQIANVQGNLEVYIRGVGSSNNTELGDPATATHVDGVYLPRPAGIGAGFFDIERVEVNIGPQGTLRGRNATAGSVNIIPWGAGLGVFDAMTEVGIGNFGEYTLEGMINVPIGDKAALRLSGLKTEHDSYLTSITPCSTELPGVDVPSCEAEGVGVGEAADDLGLRASFLYEPTDRLKIELSGDYLQQKGSGYTGVNFANALGNGIDPADIDDPRQVVGRGFTPEEDTEHYGGRLFVEYEFDDFTLEYTGGLRDLVFDYEFVTPASVAYDGVLDTLGPLDIDNFNRIRFITDSESQTHEFRLVSDDSKRFFGSVGAFFFEEDQRTFLGTTGDRNPFFQGIEFNQTTDTNSFSIFGDGTFKVTDDFRLTGGLRYTEDEKQRFGINARYAFGFGGPDFGCCFQNGVASGTEGFEFNALGRTIFNPDTSGDGLIDANESIAFLFDGIRTFGARDGFDDIFPGGQQIQDAFPNAADRPSCDAFAFVGSCANFVPDFDGVVDFSLAPFNSSFALQNGRVENDFVDWRLRAEYDLTDANLLYALISTGNKSGGFNDNIPETAGIATNPAQNAPIEFETDSFAPTYGPETLTLYELGSKNEFELENSTVTFNVSAFYYDYEDIQLTTLLSTAQVLDREGVEISQEDLEGFGGNVVGFTFNAAQAEILGAQFEGGIRFDNDLSFKGTLLWLPTAKITESEPVQDARFQADVDQDQNPGDGVNENAVARDISGNRLIRTPEIQLNASVAKSWDLGKGKLDAILSAGYRSSQNLTIFNGIDFNPLDNEDDRLLDEVDGFWTFDLGAGYTFDQDGKYRLEGYVNNLTDQQPAEAIIITAFDNTRFFRRPRTYGARLRVKY